MRPWVQWTARAVLLGASIGAAGTGAGVAFGGVTTATTLLGNQASSPVGSPVSDCGSAAAVLADPMAGCENVRGGGKQHQARRNSRQAHRFKHTLRSLLPGLPALMSPQETIAQFGSASRGHTRRLGVLASTSGLGKRPGRKPPGPTPPIAAALHSVAALPVMTDMRLLNEPQRGVTRAGRPLPASVLSVRSSPGMGTRSLLCLAIGALMAGAAALMAAGGQLRDVRR